MYYNNNYSSPNSLTNAVKPNSSSIWCLTSKSSLPADDVKMASISSRETLAVSGTRYVDQRYAKKHAVEKIIKVPDAEKLIATGVIKPIKKLLNQFDAVERATPLLLIERGKTSLGRTHPIGPNETPYAAVKT